MDGHELILLAWKPSNYHRKCDILRNAKYKQLILLDLKGRVELLT